MKKLLILLLFISNSVFAQIKGKAIAVHDGDTFTFQNDSCKITIRMAYIDAPELKQEFGPESKTFLTNKILNKKVTIHILNKDRYGRYVAVTTYYNKSVNQEMVNGGYAWVYVQYCSIKEYFTCQDNAKKKKVGLWINPNAVAPWIFRHPVKQ